MSKECLKCGLGSKATPDSTTCPHCGVVYEKYEASIAPAARKLNLAVEEYALNLRHAEAIRRRRARELQEEKQQRKAWDDKLSEQRLAEAAVAMEGPSEVPNQKLKTAVCRSCNGVVAIGVKSCPHCGQAKPAPRPPTQVTKTHLLFAGLLVILLVFIAGSNRPVMGTSSLSVEQVVQRCAKDTGIDPNSNRAVSMHDIRAMDACIQRHGIKTKP